MPQTKKEKLVHAKTKSVGEKIFSHRDRQGKDLKVGDYVHFSGWGLAKVTKLDKDSFGNPTFKVNTKTYPKQQAFGQRLAHPHELRFVDDTDAQNFIKKRKEEQKERSSR